MTSREVLRGGGRAHVLVLGATGFIGRWVARAATAAGARTTLAVRDAAAAASIFPRYEVRGETVVCDLADPDEARRLVQAVPATLIVNLVGYGVDSRERDESLSQRINADLPEALMHACAASSTRGAATLIHVGSALEYGTTGGDLAEDSPAQPGTVYGRTKLAGTEAVHRLASELGVRALTARLFTVYGPGEHPGRLLPSLIEGARAGADIPLSDGVQRRDFTFVEDVAQSLLRLADAPIRAGEIVNLSTGVMFSVRHFVECAAPLLGIAADRLRFGALPTRPEEMRHDGVRVDRLRALIGATPSADLARGIRATMEFLEGPGGVTGSPVAGR